MRIRLLLALPLLLAGCGGEDIARYQSDAGVDLVRLAPSLPGNLQEQTARPVLAANRIVSRPEAGLEIAARKQRPTHHLAAHPLRLHEAHDKKLVSQDSPDHRRPGPDTVGTHITTVPPRA